MATTHYVIPGAAFAWNKVKAGDVVFLKAGDHGDLVINNVGDHTALVNVMPENGANVFLNRLVINTCTNLVFNGKSKTSIRSKGQTPANVPLVSILGGQGNVVQWCYIHSSPSRTGWQAAQWLKTRDGVLVNGSDCKVSNNVIQNVQTGITLRGWGSDALANTIDGFCVDGIRMLADYTTASDNRIMHSYTGNPNNHNDAIQLWSAAAANPQEGVISGVIIQRNRIYNRSSDPGGMRDMQGIGCFDGVIRRALIRDNVVQVDHYHGITLGVAEYCTISGNTVMGSDPRSASQPWIMIATNKATSQISWMNTVSNNKAMDFKLTGSYTASGNQTMKPTQIASLSQADMSAVA
jgi:hypothetical protein